MICVGDDWAEDHHDVELVDEQGRRLARARLPEGLEGVGRLHGLIAEHLPPDGAELDPVEAAGRVRVGIETDRGPWVQALVAAGYQVFAINPMSVARYRERHSTSSLSRFLCKPEVIASFVSYQKMMRPGKRLISVFSATFQPCVPVPDSPPRWLVMLRSPR